MLRDVRRATRARERLWSSRRRHSCSRPPRARHCASPRITDILRRRTRSPTPLCVGVAFAVRLRTPLTATTVRPMRAWESYQGPREVTGARAHRSPLLPLAVLSYGWLRVLCFFASFSHLYHAESGLFTEFASRGLQRPQTTIPVVVLLAPLWGSTVISTFREGFVR